MYFYIVDVFQKETKIDEKLIASKVQNSNIGRCRGQVSNFESGYLKILVVRQIEMRSLPRPKFNFGRSYQDVMFITFLLVL